MIVEIPDKDINELIKKATEIRERKSTTGVGRSRSFEDSLNIIFDILLGQFDPKKEYKSNYKVK